MANRIVVIDAGTSALRAVSVTPDGVAATLAASPWPMFVPDDAAPFGREFDAPAVAALVRAFIDDHTAGADAVAFAGQREGLVFAGARGDAVLALPNIDGRASTEGMLIDDARGLEIYAATGHLPSLLQAPARFAWLRTHRPRDAARVTRVLPLADWLASTVAGDCGISRSLAAETGLLDVATGSVPRDILAASGLDPAIIPQRIHRETCVAGEAAGTPVVLAGADTQCALAGMGALAPGDAGLAAGWSAPLQAVTAAPVFDAAMRTWTSIHVVPDRWILESNASETGRAWEWVCAMLGCTPAEGADIALSAPAGSDDVMCVLSARAMNAAAMNAGVGAILLPLPFAMAAPDRARLLRSVLESIAYAVRANLEQVEAITGDAIASLRLGGGMSRSSLFCQVVADVLDRPVHVAPMADASAVGAAMLAAVAIRRLPSVDEAFAATHPARVVGPDPRASAHYEDLYARWCATADRMEELSAL